MRYLAFVLVAGLAAAGTALAAGQAQDLPATDATMWGETSPHTVLEWSYNAAPDPAIQGTPGTFLVGFDFPLDSTKLSTEARGSMVDDVFHALRRDGRLGSARLVIVGYADHVRERSDAHALGLRRAEAARDFLVSLGVKKSNIQVTSFGDRFANARPDQTYRQGFERRVGIWLED